MSERRQLFGAQCGEGKSSVIVPIVASALAGGKSLVRVFVAKPQSKQMLEMLTSKLGGLIDRVVFQMPTSRDLRVEESEARSMRKMLEVPGGGRRAPTSAGVCPLTAANGYEVRERSRGEGRRGSSKSEPASLTPGCSGYR